MDETDTFNTIMKQAKSIRQGISISHPQIQNYLNYQSSKISNNKSGNWASGLCYRPKTQVNKSFRRAFKTLTKLEQAEFYLLNVTNVNRLQNDCHQKSVNEFSNRLAKNSEQEEVISIIFEIADGKNYKKLTEVTTTIMTKLKIIRIQDTREQIDLHSYLLRKSRNKNKNALVLQSMEAFTQTETVRIVFSSIDFEDSFNLVYGLWAQAQYQNLQKIFDTDKTFPRKQIRGLSLKNSLGTDFGQKDETQKILSQKVLSDSLRDEKTQGQLKNSLNKSTNKGKLQNMLVSSDLIQSLNSFKNFEQQSFGIFYSQDKSKVRRVFQLNKDNYTLEQIKNMIEDVKFIKNRKKSMTDIKLLNSIPSERTSIIREVNEVQGKQYEFIYFRNYFAADKVYYFFEKSIDLEELRNKNSSITKSNINSCIWRIKQIGNKIEVLVEANITFYKNIHNPLKVIQSYIGDFSTNQKQNNNQQKPQSEVSFDSNEFQNQFLSMISDSENFFSASGSINNTYVETNPPNMLKKNFQNFDPELNQSDSGNKETATQSSNTESYLKHRYQNQPKTKLSPKYLKEPIGHILWGQKWKVNQSGELVNLEKQKIKLQSSVLKLVVKRMGKNLLSGKSIMNTSLPIQIFGTDSNLQRIARGFIYAPIFLELAAKQKNPVDRIKYVFCFGLGFSIAYIKMQKPFNPTIGETFQGAIDGCPVYAQQISHHPPISSLYMCGRGYNAYGNFQAKVQLGMNTASGINDGFNHIEFEDGCLVKFNTPPGEMQGIIIGDRKLTLTKKSYYIDQKNKLICEISWGKNKKHHSDLGKFSDFFCGKVVEVSDVKYVSDFKKIKAEHIVTEYGQIYGRFNGKVFFDGEEIFDVSLDAPLEIDYYNPCLESDSRLRKDIIEKKKGNISAAQQYKQEIENIQRQDKKLRKHH